MENKKTDCWLYEVLVFSYYPFSEMCSISYLQKFKLRWQLKLNITPSNVSEPRTGHGERVLGFLRPDGTEGTWHWFSCALCQSSSEQEKNISNPISYFLLIESAFFTNLCTVSSWHSITSKRKRGQSILIDPRLMRLLISHFQQCGHTRKAGCSLSGFSATLFSPREDWKGGMWEKLIHSGPNIPTPGGMFWG